MPGLRAAAVAAAALPLTGGVVYVLWTIRKRREAEKVTLNLKAEKGEKLVEQERRRETAREAAAVPQRRAQLDLDSPVLVLGLDGAGKTSLLQCFATGTVEREVSPTQGLHALSVNRDDLHIKLLEIGGNEKLREYWPMYVKRARVLVFVLDAADSARFPLAKTSLHHLLASDPYLPLVLLANKQDLTGACGVTELYELMELSSAGNGRKLYVLGTQVGRGSPEVHPSTQDAYELIIETMNSAE